MTVKEHYENHLGHFYSWMIGDFQTKSDDFLSFFKVNSIQPVSNKNAIDLGAGNGLQSIPLAKLGFKVLAVDFNQQLLDELKINAQNLDIQTLLCDIKKIESLADKPELILCCGDTLSHLDNKSEVRSFISSIVKSLSKNGKLILSFRDYSIVLTGMDRFIPVKSDDNKILTCILDYDEEFVHVTDLLHEKIYDSWQQKVSTYKKVRLSAIEIVGYLESAGLAVIFNNSVNYLVTIIAKKQV